MRKLLFILLILPAILYAQPDTLWTRYYNSAGDEYPAEVVETSDHGFAIAASSNTMGVDLDFRLIRTNENGDTLWTHYYPHVGSDLVNALIQTSDGGFLLGGFFNNFETLTDQMYVVKTNSEGTFEWERTHGGNNHNETCNALMEYPAGYLLVGNNYRTGEDYQIITVRTDALGAPLWSGGFSDSPAWLGASAAIRTSTGFAIAGWYSTDAGQTQNVLAIKADTTGNLYWFRNYGGDGLEEGLSIQQLSNGGFMVGGMTESFGDPNGDFYLLKLNSFGDTVWTRTYGGEGEQHSHDCVVTPDDGCILVGHSEHNDEGNLLVVKANPTTGITDWSYEYEHPGYQGGESVIMTYDHGFAVAGQDIQDFGGSDVFLMRFASIQSSIDENTFGHPLSFSLSAYPNPFNPRTEIAFSLGHSQNITLKIFDIEGREVKTLADGNYSAGTHIIAFDAVNLPSGIYFSQLASADHVETKKMVLLK